MAYRRKSIPKKRSRRLFRKTSGSHRKNLGSTSPMRGGIRL